jgi:hypothetical protein
VHVTLTNNRVKQHVAAATAEKKQVALFAQVTVLYTHRWAHDTTMTGMMIGNTLAHTSHHAKYHHRNDHNAHTTVVNDSSEMMKSKTVYRMTDAIDRPRIITTTLRGSPARNTHGTRYHGNTRKGIYHHRNHQSIPIDTCTHGNPACLHGPGVCMQGGTQCMCACGDLACPYVHGGLAWCGDLAGMDRFKASEITIYFDYYHSC